MSQRLLVPPKPATVLRPTPASLRNGVLHDGDAETGDHADFATPESSFDSVGSPAVGAPRPPSDDPGGPPATDFTRLHARAPNHIQDEDLARAVITRLLLEELMPRLGVDPARISVCVTRPGEATLDAAGASGLQEGTTILLHPRRYRPATVEGRRLLAHEAVHSAQRTIDGTADVRAAEAEASEIAEAFAIRAPLRRPAVALPALMVAADTGVQAELPFDTMVQRNHEPELARIHKLLGGWWISDGDVDKVLLILKSVAPPSAVALIKALTSAERVDLVDNMHSVHRKKYRAEVLLCYAALEPGEIREHFDEDLFEDMDLVNLEMTQALVIAFVVGNLAPKAQRKLRTGDSGAAIRAIEQFVADPNNKENLDEAVRLERSKALDEERELTKTRKDVEATRLKDERENKGKLAKLVSSIRERLDSWIVTDRDALGILDDLIPYVHDMSAMRLIADELVTHHYEKRDGQSQYTEDKDYLQELIDQVPVKALYDQTSARRRVFLQLLVVRPGYKSIESVLKLTSEIDVKTPIIGLFINAIAGFFSHVDSEEAYLAYQLVRSMPARARRAIMEFEGGERWGKVTANMSVSQFAGDTTNFYQGGKKGEDRDALLSQLLLDEVWTDPVRLRGVVNMAIAAGHYDWVFAESRRRYEARTGYGSADVLAVAESLRLYNPEAVNDKGEKAPRLKPDSSLLQGNPFWNEGNLGWINQKVIGGLDFIFSSKDVETAATAMGGTGLNLAEFQDITGGTFLGARFEQLDKLGMAGAEAKRRKKGVNFANVQWDRNLGVLKLQAEHLAIAAINYPLADLTIRTGRIDLRNVDVTLRYPTDATKNQLNVIDLYIGEAQVDKLLLVAPDNMKSVNDLTLQGLHVLVQPSGKDVSQLDKPRDGMLVDGAGGMFANILLFPMGGAAGLGAAVNVAKSGASGKELGQNILKPSSGMEMEISLRSLKLSGITTSGGGFVESVVIENLDIGGGGTVEAYLSALSVSVLRLTTRLQRERKAEADATDDKERTTHRRAAEQLEKQIAHANAETARIEASQAEIARIEAQRKALAAEKPPKELSNEDRAKLKTLKTALMGTVVDIGHVKITGMAGAPVQDLDLGNLHGQGHSTVALLGMLSDSDTLSRFIEGGQPAVKDPDKNAAFTLDVGHIELPDLKLKGGIPTPGDAQQDLEKLRTSMDRSRPEHVARLEQLEQRLDQATKFDSLVKIGPEKLTAQQRADFIALRRQLETFEEENAFRIRSVTMEGASLRFDAQGGVGIGADELNAVGLVDPKTGLKIDSVAARKFAVDAKLKGGALGLKDWRTNLQSGRLSAASLQIKGIDDPDSGLGAEEIAFESDDDRAALSASLDVSGGDARARLATRRVTVKGASFAFSERLLRLAKARLDQRDDSKLTPPQKAKRAATLRELEHFLGTLDEIKAAIAQDELDLAQAKTAKNQAKMEAASKALAMDRDNLETWQQKVSLAKLTATDLDLSLRGLGAVLSEDWSFDKALDSGVTIEAGTPDGAMVGGVVMNGLVVRQNGHEMVNVQEVAIGPIKGSIEYTSSYIRIRNLSIDQSAVDGLAYLSPNTSIWSNGRSTIKNLTVSALIRLAQKPDADRPNETYMSSVEVDEFHIDRIDAQSLGYEDREKGLHVDVSSGALRDISMRALSFELSPDDLAEMKIHEDKTKATKGKPTGVQVGGFDDIKVAATLAGGLTAGGRLNASTLSVHFAESGGKDIDLASLSVADGKVKKGDLALDVEADVKGVHVSLLPGGTVKGRAKDVSVGVKGKMGKHSFDARVEHADTGEMSYDGKFIDMPGLNLPSIKLNLLSVNSPDFGLQIPSGSPAEMIGTKASVSVELNPDAKAGDPPVKRIYIYEFGATSLATKGFTVTVPSKGLTITLPAGSSGVISDIHMLPGDEFQEAFLLDAEHDWNMYGSLGFKSGTLKKLGADLPGLWVKNADVSLETFSMGFLGNKGSTIDLDKATLESIEGSIKGSDFTVMKGDVKAGGTRHKEATPGLTIRGFKKTASGDVTIEGIDLQGFRYHDKGLGLQIDLKQAELPRREAGKPAFEMLDDGTVRIPELKISEAFFHIDDVLHMGGGPKTSGGPDYGPDWSFLDKISGHINFDVHAHGMWAINVFDSEYQIRVPITDGKFDFSEVEDEAFGFGDAVVDFRYIAPQYNGLVPARFDISISGTHIWWDLSGDEATLAESDQLRISTFFKHKAKTAQPMPWDPPPERSLDELRFYNVDVDLRLPGKTRIQLGDAGYIQLAEDKNGLPFRLQAADDTGHKIKSLPINLTAHVAEMQLKTDALGSRLTTGAVDISSVGLTKLSFEPTAVGPNTMDMPKSLEGTLESATARNIEWSPAKKSSKK